MSATRHLLAGLCLLFLCLTVTAAPRAADHRDSVAACPSEVTLQPIVQHNLPPAPPWLTHPPGPALT